MSNSLSWSWLKRWTKALLPRRPIQRRHKTPLRLLLERLEDRMVPAPVVWLNNVSGDWDTPGNWLDLSNSTNHVPTAADDASITFASITVTHNSATPDAVHSLTSAASVSLAAGSISIAGLGNLNNAFTLSGGSLLSASTTTLAGPTLWTAGTIGGAGTTNLEGSTTISGSPTLDTATLDNFGSVSDSATITLANTAVINNESGATWTFPGSASAGGSGTFNNFDTVIDSSTVMVTIGVPFNNSGTVQVQDGDFNPSGGGTNTGTFSVAARLDLFGSPYTFATGTVVNGNGTLDIDTGTLNVTGNSTISPNVVDVDAGTLNVTGNSTINSSLVDVDAGTVTVTVPGSVVISGTKFDLDAGSMTVAGSATINSATTDGDGGALTVNGSILISSGTEFDLDGATMTVGGSATINSPLVDIDGGLLNVTGNCVINANNKFDLDGGTITVGGSASATISSPLVDGDGGMLTVNGSCLVTGSTIDMDGATLNGSGTATLQPSSEFLFDSGTMSGTGITNLEGSTSISGGTLDTRTLNNFGTVTDSDSFFPLSNGAVINNESGATWNLQGSASIGGSGIFNNLGVLNTTGNDTVSVVFNNSDSIAVQSGSLTILGNGLDPATITIAGGASMTYSGASDTFSNGTLVNGAGTLVFNGNETATVTGNVSFASANFTFDTSTLTGSGTVTVTSATTWNNGTMSGTGATVLDGSTTISGTAAVNARTLDNVGTVSDSATITLTNAAVILNDGSATWTLQGSNSIGGNGTFDDFGSLNVASGDSTLNCTGIVLQSSGSFNVFAGLDIGPASQFNWGGSIVGTGAGTSLIELDGVSDLTFNQSLSSITLSNFGSVSQTFDTLTCNSTLIFNDFDWSMSSSSIDDAAISNNGLWSMSGSSIGGAFNNGGTLTATGTNGISGEFNNSGLVHVITGALTATFDQGGVDSGGLFTIEGGASMTFSAGSDNFTDGTLVNGAGTLVLSGNETLTATGNVTIGSGNFTFNNSTLAGSGNVTVGATTAAAWNNDTVSMSGTSTVTLLGNTTTTITGARNLINTGTLNNFGTVTDNSATITINSAAVANNESGATWNTQGTPLIAGLGQFNNFGTMTGSGDTTIAVPVFVLPPGATLDGSGNWRIPSGTQFIWNGGTISGTATTTLLGSSTFSGVDTIDTATLNNFGIVTDNSATIAMKNNAVMNNESGATWTMQGSASIGGLGTFNNHGILTSNGNDTVSVAFNSSDSVSVQSGTLTILGNGVDSGTFTLGSATSTLTFSAGSDTFTNGTLVNGPGTFVINSNETLTTAGNVTFGSASFTLDSSKLVDTGNLTVTSATTWHNSDLSGSGTTTLTGSSTTTLSGNDSMDTGTLNNFGTVAQTTGNLLSVFNNATINNDNSWTMNDATISGVGVFNNTGTLTLNGTDVIDLTTFTSSGGIGGPGHGRIFNFVWNNGTISGSTLDLFGNSLFLGHDFINAATLNNFGAVTDDATITMSSAAVMNNEIGATWNLDSNASIGGVGAFNDLGLLTTSGNSTISNTSFTLQGNFNDSDSVTIGPSTQFFWTGGTLSGTGTTTLTGSTTTTISGSVTMDTGTLNNFGKVSDSASITMNNAAVINNDSVGLWNLQGNASIGGSGTFNNLGILTSNGNDSITGASFNNSDSVSVQTGTLTVQNEAGIDSHTFTIAGGASLTYSAGSDTFTNGTLVNGAGTFIVSGNETLTTTGNVTVGSASFTFNNSTLANFGDITVTAATTWNNDTLSMSGTTNLLGSTTITGTDFINTGTLNNFGRVLQSGAAIVLSNATVNNDAGWNMVNSSISGVGSFNNGGTLTANGINGISASLNNDGLVHVQTGTLAVQNEAGVDSGTFTIDSGANLIFSAGSDTFTNGTLVNGAGTLVLTNNETLTATGNVSFTSANFTLNSSTLTGSGTVTVTSATIWNNSTMSGTGLTILKGSSNIFGTDTLGTRTLNNFGTVSDSANITLTNAAVINNEGNATWTLQGNASIGGTGAFNDLGTLTTIGSSTINNTTVTLQPGSLVNGAGIVTFGPNSHLAWSGGTMAGSGITNLEGTSTLTLNESLNTRTLNNLGTVAQSGDALVLSNAAVVNNDAGWNMVNSSISGVGSFNNGGTLTANGINGISASLNNGGLVHVQTGTLAVQNEAGVDSGTFTIDSGANLIFSAASDTFTNGTLVNGAGTLVLSNSETLTVTGNVSFASANFTFNGSTLTGSGTAIVTSTTIWNNSAMSGTGVTILDGNSNVFGTDALDTRTLNNFGTVSDNANITESNAATINNESGATWNLFGGTNLGGSGTFNDLGILTTTGTSALNNTTVTLQMGGALNGGGTVSIGATFLWSNGVMSGTGVTNLNSNSAFASAVALDTRTLNNFGTVSDNANITESNAATINNESGATWNLFGGTNLGGSGTFNDLGILTTIGTSTLNNTTVTLQPGGVLNGSGAVLIGATFLWSGGAMKDPGITKLNSNSAFSGAISLDMRTLNNVGTVSDSAALSVNGAAINNGSGATWIIQNGSSIVGSGQFANYGPLTAKGGSTVSINFLNAPTGLVLVQAGANVTFGAVENVGYFVVDGSGAPVAAATFASFTQPVGVLTGAGILGGSINVTGGEVDPGTPSSLAPGALTSQGSVSLSSATTLNIRLNGTTVGNGSASSGYDQLVLGPNASASALNDSYLVLWVQPGFDPQVNDTFTIINNQSNEPGSALGQLMGYETNGVNPPVLTSLVEGSIFQANNGDLFVISYVGGDGNDVTVTRVSNNFAFVRQLYADILQRGLHSTAEASYWTNLLDSNTLTYGGVASGILNSAESYGIQVDEFYTQLLKRQATPSEQAFWVNQMLFGLSPTDVVLGIIASSEYQGMHSDVNDYVNALYNDLLTVPYQTGTTVDGMDLSFYVNVLVTAKATRGQVAAAFLSSTEAFQDAIKEDYFVLLGRPKDAPIQANEMQYWLALRAIRGDLTPADVLSMITSSQEFLGHMSATPPD